MTAHTDARLRRLEWEAQNATAWRRLCEWQLLGILAGSVAAFLIVWAFSIGSDWGGLFIAVACQVMGQGVAAAVSTRQAASLGGSEP